MITKQKSKKRGRGLRGSRGTKKMGAGQLGGHIAIIGGGKFYDTWKKKKWSNMGEGGNGGFLGLSIWSILSKKK